MFPSENPWNQRVDRLPVAGNSTRLIASIGLGNPVHPDFGSGLDDDDRLTGRDFEVVNTSSLPHPGA